MPNKTHVSSKKSWDVANAGLIILHPFLKDLFKKCNLIHPDNTLKNNEMCANILYYAATKKEHCYECNMLFEKFLCGIPLWQPINQNVDIDPLFKENVEEMLVAVVNHWSVLKNSKTTLLRTEFLQRTGKLNLENNNQKLLVARKTQDILLDKISWNISIAKIPWIEKLVYTEW